MGEIKSTLDIVMERTKHLTLSDEEKQEQKYQEFRKNLNGLIRKFQDKALSLDQLKRALDALQEKHEVADKNVLSGEIAGKLQIDQDNGPFLMLLKEICGLNMTAIESVFDDYQNTIRSATLARLHELKEELAKKYFISGDAVLPNVEADPVWAGAVQSVRDNFGRLLDQERAVITGA
ncbi:hypothetical protein QUF72_12400 [Desulfobacterales bacterium HSG2]|nr:hypothetical protein [Desulfobacterales bacterium HSG2]